MHAMIENGKIRLLALLFVSSLLIVVSSTLSHAATVLVATGPGPGHPRVVRVTVEGRNGNETFSFMAYQKNFSGGVRVAVGDVNGDGFADVITGSGAGAQLVLHNFLAFEPDFLGGVFVAGTPARADR